MKNTVEDLIRINEVFEEVEDYNYVKFDDYEGLSILMDNEVHHFEVSQREFGQIQNNFYISTLNELILAGLEGEFESVKDSPDSKEYPLAVTLKNGEIFVMNYEEFLFIFNAMLLQI